MSKKILIICGLIIAGSCFCARAMRQGDPLSEHDLAGVKEIFVTKHPQALAQSILWHDHEFRLHLEKKIRTYSEQGRLKFLAKLLHEELQKKDLLLGDLVDSNGNNVLHALLEQETLSNYSEIAILCAITIVLMAAGNDVKDLVVQSNIKSLTPLNLAASNKKFQTIADLLKKYE